MNASTKLLPPIIYTFGSAVLDQTATHSSYPLQDLRENAKQYVNTIELSLGGGALNSAKVLQQYNCTVYPVCTVGTDYAGNTLLQLLTQQNIKTDYIIKSKSITTRQSWIIPTAHETHIISYATPEHELTAHDLPKDFPHASLFFIAPLHTADPATLRTIIEQAQALSIPVACIASTKQLQNPAFVELYKQTTLLICNRKEALSCAPTLEAFGAHFTKTVPFVCVTADKDGAYLFTPLQHAHMPAVPVKVKNTTGAGDVFAATLAYELLLNKTSTQQALTTALEASAYHISR